MKMPLSGKVAMVPGASRPIGRAIAHRFAKEGATLILPVFDWPESIVEMEAEFGACGYRWHTQQIDLRVGREVAAFAATIGALFGRIDYLINNIERGGMPIVHGSYDLPHNSGQWELEFATTLTAKWLLYHHFSPLMQGSLGGAVVNLSSIAALLGRSGPTSAFFSDGYGAANGGIRTFTETWAREMAPSIRVNELMLGLIAFRHGEGTRGWNALEEEQRQEVLTSIPLRRTGEPQEVAETVYFLAVQATYLTGAIVRLDGGMALGSAAVPPTPPGILP